jgi:hypothetical protein
MHSLQLHNQASSTYVSTRRLFKRAILLTVLLVAQGWQYKACPVPEHDAGPLTARLAYFFLALGAVCVGCRFLARWRIHNSTVGIDDWTILVSYILMIPAAILIIMSESPQLEFIVLAMLIMAYQWLRMAWERISGASRPKTLL